MDVSIQPNPYRIRTITVTPNEHMPDLLTLRVDEDTADLRLTLDTDIWQRVTDELAAAGVVPGGHRTTILSWGVPVEATS